MACEDHLFRNSLFLLILANVLQNGLGNDILGCGGFVKSHVPLDFSKIEIGLYTKTGSLKERTECAPTNGYYFLPLYDKGEYVLRVHPPAGWSFEPSQVELSVDGKSDPCSTNQDVDFSFNGFGITGSVITAGQSQGPAGIAVQLVDDKGEKRDTVTAVGGDFHFTPVIPGKYTLQASHPKWKLDPAQAVVQVKEGNTALPAGVLAVKGYDVKGSVISYGSPISGVYVLLYSKEENPKFRVEGCQTSLLQGVPDAPICHAVTDAGGEFSFGLVPAGEYRLLALPQTPGQASLRYNIKPDSVPFSVAHDSLYIKNAFEITGFNVVGSVVTSASGGGVAGVRVLQDGQPVGSTDAAGKFTLPSLQPGTYSLSFQHEQCKIEDVSLVVSAAGPGAAPVARAAAWRVCGQVAPPPAPPAPRRLALTSEEGAPAATVTVTDSGKWCTFLPPGVYTAKVEVSEAEQREGLQFYPLTQKVSVGRAPVDGIHFSQLKATLTGKVVCMSSKDCDNLKVTLKPLSPDGGYVGQPMTTTVKDGQYTFTDVLPGSVEVSVPTVRLCWAEARHNAAVATERATVPAFEHTGYVITLHASHHMQVEYSCEGSSSAGVWSVPAGRSAQCVTSPARHTLTPRGPHTFQPARAHASADSAHTNTVQFTAVAHAVVIAVLSPVSVDDLHLVANGKRVGPLVPLALPGGGYRFEHALYMADGEIAAVSAESSSLLFQPSDPQQVIGRGDHQPSALTLRALRGLTLAGRLVPPVEGVLVTLSVGDLKLTHTTTKDGTYSFGPLDASRHYTVTAEKESYTFGDRDENGDIAAHKLAEIVVQLVDEADNSPLQGALVSVSGGAYRRTLVAGPSAGGRLVFPALPPGQYYVKPHMKEYRLAPPHHTAHLAAGQTATLTLKGVRVAWSCVGRLLSVGGAGWGGATIQATPTGGGEGCVKEEASSEPSGAFRVRGLLPGCVYRLQLKQDALALRLAKAPPALEIKDKKDISGVVLIAVQPPPLTDVTALVHTPHVDHYRTLRLSLALETNPHSPIYSTKLDAAGYSQHSNPGVLHVLPRLPADNHTYVLQLESSLSRATHAFEEEALYFTSDGQVKALHVQFLPRVKSSEQELRQTSLLVLPLLALLLAAFVHRAPLRAHARAALAPLAPLTPRAHAAAKRNKKTKEN